MERARARERDKSGCDACAPHRRRPPHSPPSAADPCARALIVMGERSPPRARGRRGLLSPRRRTWACREEEETPEHPPTDSETHVQTAARVERRVERARHRARGEQAGHGAERHRGRLPLDVLERDHRGARRRLLKRGQVVARDTDTQRRARAVAATPSPRAHAEDGTGRVITVRVACACLRSSFFSVSIGRL